MIFYILHPWFYGATLALTGRSVAKDASPWQICDFKKPLPSPVFCLSML